MINDDSKEVDLLVAQIDGSMVPIVEYSEATKEQQSKGLKKNRNCHWREFRLCSVSNPQNFEKYYGVVLGSPLEAGCMMYQTCKALGMNENTHIHGVADGAPWIAEQYEQQFGMNHDFYIDFYHASEYLAAASKDLKSTQCKESALEWQLSRSTMLLEGRSEELITELKELSQSGTAENALTKAYQYLNNREGALNYPKALDADLPIGSGEVESGHRSVLQARLKKPGAWWRIENAENMAHLKVLQENGHWDEFWTDLLVNKFFG